MSFNPLHEKGIPLDRQLRNWSELNVDPYDKNSVHPYTQTRAITLNGAEMEAMWFSHQLSRHTRDPDLKRKIAFTRRIEQQQQKVVNWLIPGKASNLEVTIGYEQVAVDLTAWLARNEPDPYLRQAYEFGLLEDFDHLYRYADLMHLMEGTRAERITGDYTEIMPGRPTIAEHRHPYDDINRPMDGKRADPRSILNAMTIVAAEQQTMNFYNNAGNRPEDPLARSLYLEIAMIEEQHVSHYESLLDPGTSWLERLVWHEYNECRLYHAFHRDEPDLRIKQLWELHLNMEIEHLKVACELMKKYEGRDPEEFLPRSMPEGPTFEDNKAYIRKVLADQVELTGNLDTWEPVSKLPQGHRYFEYQRKVNQVPVPSEQVIHRHRTAHNGEDYRYQPAGEHPVEHLRGGPQRGRS